MTTEQERRYDGLLNKATHTNLRPAEEVELRDLSNIRVEALTRAKKAKEFENGRPVYEWDYPIIKRDNEQ